MHVWSDVIYWPAAKHSGSQKSYFVKEFSALFFNKTDRSSQATEKSMEHLLHIGNCINIEQKTFYLIF